MTSTMQCRDKRIDQSSLVQLSLARQTSGNLLSTKATVFYVVGQLEFVRKYQPLPVRTCGRMICAGHLNSGGLWQVLLEFQISISVGIETLGSLVAPPISAAFYPTKLATGTISS